MISTFRFDTSDSVHTYVIGDIHGCADLLDEMLWGIKRRARRAGVEYRIVFLGDIMDRGPHSKWAIDLVIEALAEVPGSRLILGNHDWLLLRISTMRGCQTRRNTAPIESVLAAQLPFVRMAIPKAPLVRRDSVSS